MARNRRNWIQEERRNTLGHWVAVCFECGHTQRYFEELAAEVPAACPQCHATLHTRCAACGSRFASAFQVECERCATELRPATLFGTPIRRAGK